MVFSLIGIFCLYYIENGSKMLAISTVFDTQSIYIMTKIVFHCIGGTVMYHLWNNLFLDVIFCYFLLKEHQCRWFLSLKKKKRQYTLHKFLRSPEQQWQGKINRRKKLTSQTKFQWPPLVPWDAVIFQMFSLLPSKEMAVNSGHCVELEVHVGHWSSGFQQFKERTTSK